MRIYDGPFEPPPAVLLKDAIGWRFTNKIHFNNMSRWRPTAWQIIFPESVLTVDMTTGMAIKDSMLYSPTLKENA